MRVFIARCIDPVFFGEDEDSGQLYPATRLRQRYGRCNTVNEHERSRVLRPAAAKAWGDGTVLNWVLPFCSRITVLIVCSRVVASAGVEFVGAISGSSRGTGGWKPGRLSFRGPAGGLELVEVREITL